MKAEELMIGDWVKISHLNKIGKVYRIDRANGEGNGFAAVIDGDYYEGNLEPIPLTTEILEKNGFSSNYAEDDLSYAESCGDIIGIHIYGKNGLMDEMYFKYVHQLQQALRLCGIEKEIVL